MIRIRKGSCGTTLRDVSRGMNRRSPLVIGLVNNMPDGALQATERQFCDLLAEAAGSLLIFVRFFSMPELRRSEAGRAYVSQRYEDIGAMLTDRLDGLIVTGAEPRAAELSDEPYWHTMTKVVDWAEDHTTSTVWSCLAAHAAVLHSDGIRRRPFREKLSGVFECAKVADHEIVSGHPSRWCVPHSRFNDLREDDLVANDFCVLSRSPEAGADLFVRRSAESFDLSAGASGIRRRRAVSRVSARHPRVRRPRNGSLSCDAARLFRRSHRGRTKRISGACDARSRHPRRSEFSRCGIEVGA